MNLDFTRHFITILKNTKYKYCGGDPPEEHALALRSVVSQGLRHVALLVVSIFFVCNFPNYTLNMLKHSNPKRISHSII